VRLSGVEWGLRGRGKPVAPSKIMDKLVGILATILAPFLQSLAKNLISFIASAIDQWRKDEELKKHKKMLEEARELDKTDPVEGAKKREDIYDDFT